MPTRAEVYGALHDLLIELRPAAREKLRAEHLQPLFPGVPVTWLRTELNRFRGLPSVDLINA